MWRVLHLLRVGEKNVIMNKSYSLGNQVLNTDYMDIIA